MHDKPMQPVRWLASPHFNHRPPGIGIDLIAVHAISLPPGEFGSAYIDDFFTGNLDTAADSCLADLQDVRVSAHFVIDRQGIITQFVACTDRAWHAGRSSWQGRDNCNDFAIGIELIGDETHPFTRLQYRECARLCRTLMQRFTNITKDRIVGHQDIAPDRKWDPGRQWDWTHFRRSLASIKHLIPDIQ